MSSNNNYYEFKDAKVAIAMELVKRGWKLYGFHEDESDWMTDYWSPAWWEGIATKDGFVVVVDCRWNDKSGKEIILGYISGSYKERFLKWIETGALAWCEIQEVKTPYKVKKCVKKKIG